MHICGRRGEHINERIFQLETPKRRGHLGDLNVIGRIILTFDYYRTILGIDHYWMILGITVCLDSRSRMNGTLSPCLSAWYLNTDVTLPITVSNRKIKDTLENHRIAGFVDFVHTSSGIVTKTRFRNWICVCPQVLMARNVLRYIGQRFILFIPCIVINQT
jgi:hypothetical protein